RGSVAGRVVLEGKAVHVADIKADPEIRLTVGSGFANVRTVLGVPMLREGTPTGVLVLTRSTVEPFTDKQIELVTTFADQAVIAIENARLFDEVQARTAELSESLEQQTATAGILSFISNSLNDTQPVFDAIVESGLKLFPGATVVIMLADGNKVDAAAFAAPDPAGIEALRRRLPIPLTREYMTSTAILDRKIVDVPDVATTAGTGGRRPQLPGQRLSRAHDHADDARRCRDRCVDRRAARARAAHGQAACGAQDVRRSGRHRHREHTPAQRAPRVTAAADR